MNESFPEFETMHFTQKSIEPYIRHYLKVILQRRISADRIRVYLSPVPSVPVFIGREVRKNSMTFYAFVNFADRYITGVTDWINFNYLGEYKNKFYLGITTQFRSYDNQTRIEFHESLSRKNGSLDIKLSHNRSFWSDLSEHFTKLFCQSDFAEDFRWGDSHPPRNRRLVNKISDDGEIEYGERLHADEFPGDAPFYGTLIPLDDNDFE